MDIRMICFAFFLFFFPIHVMAQENAIPTDIERSATYDEMLAYVSGMEEIIHRQNMTCDDVARELAAYDRDHSEWKQNLEYASSRISDDQTQMLMHKAHEIGKKLADCYDHRALTFLLNRMAEAD